MTDVDRLVDDQPRDRLVTSGLGQRSLVSHVVFRFRYQIAHHHVTHAHLLTLKPADVSATRSSGDGDQNIVNTCDQCRPPLVMTDVAPLVEKGAM